MTIRPTALLGATLAFTLLLSASAPLAAHAADSGIRVSSVSVTSTKVPPSCKARSTKKRMASGNVTTIVWESRNAERMTGLTLDERSWPPAGRERIGIGFVGKHEFPLTFIGKGGTTTCIAKIFVKPRKD